LMADLFSMAGGTEQGARLYNELLKDLPDSSGVRDRLRAKLADVYLRGQDRKRATEQLEAIVKDDPTNAHAYYLLGSLAFESKEYDTAADHFRKTILLNPDFEPSYYDLTSSLLNLNKPDEALVVLEKARSKFPQSFAVEFLSGMAFSRKKGFAEAARHFTAAEVIAKATDPKRLDESFYFQLGATSERKGDYDQAARYFQTALEKSPDFAEALNYLGYMWAEQGTNLPKAKDLIERALKIEPKNAAFLDSMGWVLFRLGQPSEALPYALKAAELSDEPDAVLYDHIGDIYAALKQGEKARASWEKSLSIEATDAVRKKLEPPTAHAVPGT